MFLTTNKGHGFSDAVISMKEGLRIDDFEVMTKQAFQKEQGNMFKKNETKRINKKRTGGCFPFSHKIEDE